MSYIDFMELIRRTAADKVLINISINIDRKPKYDEIISNKVLPEELQKPIIREFYKKNVH